MRILAIESSCDETAAAVVVDAEGHVRVGLLALLLLLIAASSAALLDLLHLDDHLRPPRRHRLDL